jgi:hypothetical protein
MQSQARPGSPQGDAPLTHRMMAKIKTLPRCVAHLRREHVANCTAEVGYGRGCLRESWPGTGSALRAVVPSCSGHRATTADLSLSQQLSLLIVKMRSHSRHRHCSQAAAERSHALLPTAFARSVRHTIYESPHAPRRRVTASRYGGNMRRRTLTGLPRLNPAQPRVQNVLMDSMRTRQRDRIFEQRVNADTERSLSFATLSLAT